VEGNTGFSFTVERAQGLVRPTAVAVTINPSQIQLLLGEADRLKAKAQHLNEQLTSGNPAAKHALLRNGLQEALADLDKTEATFKQKGVEQSSVRTVNAFFDDIRFDYGEALKVLGNESAQLRQDGPWLLRVGAPRAGMSAGVTRASAAVLNSILRNAKAYDIVASSGAVTFNLEVYSVPNGAKISYRQRGGEYHSVDHETDWQIENLVRAVWLIRVQKPGYEDKEESFDAVASTRTSIKIVLARKRSAK